jgi:branched-chain amino acid transport system ATP-binding protein
MSAATAAPARGLLRAEGLTRRFGALTAVDDVSFDLHEKEILSVVGPNGAGKTTLFNLLSGQLSPSSGRVEFDGRDISRLRPFERCRLGIARTFQIVRPLLGLTTLENVMVGAFLRHRTRHAAKEAAQAVLEETGLGDRATALAGELTLVQRKRLEVARALATEPRVLLLDEVMAGLTPPEVDRAIELFRVIHSRGMTLLVVEHNLTVVRTLSRRAIVVDHGARLAEGTPDEVFAMPQVIEAYLGL